MIAVHGPDDAEFVLAQNWVYMPADEGELTIEADRGLIRSFLKASLQSRIAWLEAQPTQLSLCRYLKARFHDWADPGDFHTQRSEEDFLSYFGLPSLAKVLKVRNIGALVCAVLSDNISMIHRLVQAKAPIGAHCDQMLSVDVLHWTPLHLAVQRGSRALPVIAKLLELRADPNSTDTLGAPLLGISRDPATVEFLVEHRANVNLQTGMVKVSPLALSLAKVSPVSVVSKLLELRADANGRVAHGGLGHSALSNLTWFSRAVPSTAVELAAVLVNARADANAPGTPGGVCRGLEITYRVGLCLGSRSAYASYWANASSGPLGYAALCGHSQMISFLLAARAHPDVPNSRGVTPRQLADSQVQHIFSEHTVNPKEEHLSKECSPGQQTQSQCHYGFLEDSNECCNWGVADSSRYHEETLDSNEWDLPQECFPKPLRSSNSAVTRSEHAHPSSPSSLQDVVAVML